MARFWTAGEMAELARQRRAGAKLAVLAARFGRSPASVAQKLGRMGVVVESWRLAFRSREYGKTLAACRRLLLAGETVTGAAERLGVDHSYVSRVRKSLGLPAATRSERVSRSWALRKARGDRPPDRWAKAREGVPA